MKRTLELYFNPKLHKYSDIYGNVYTSVTTLIGKYEKHFDSSKIAAACELIGRNPNHPKYLKYKGKTKEQLIVEWEDNKNNACDKGNIQHNYFEEAIKESNGYTRVLDKYTKGRICTVENIISDPTYGVLDLDYFKSKGVEKYFPSIYSSLAYVTEKGYKVYSEAGVYDFKHLISGLIDVFIYHPDKGYFLIFDWKTNNAPLTFQAGYYEKDARGEITSEFVHKDTLFNYPIDHLPQSKGNVYGLQLQFYANLASKFGIEHKGSILFHITHNTGKDGLQIVEQHKLPDFTKEVELLIEHHSITKQKNKTQGKLFSGLKIVS